MEESRETTAREKEQEHQLRMLAVLYDVFTNLVLETTPQGLLQRLLEGVSYLTKSEFGIACSFYPDGTRCFAQVGLRFAEKEAEEVGRQLLLLIQPASRPSHKIKIYNDPAATRRLSPPLPPFESTRAIGLFLGEQQIGALLLCHSQPDFDFMKGESALLHMVVQAGLMAEKFDLFRQIEKKSKDLEEANDRLAEVLLESEEKNQHLRLANEAIEQSKRELESFVYTASHDLKAPVVSLYGMASVLMEDYGDKLDEKGKHYLDRLISNASFMEQLIADLLEFSRVGRREEKPEQLNAEDIIKNVLDQCYSSIQARSVKVVCTASLPPSIFFDRTRLTQVFLNLISNSIKFMGDQASPMVEIGGRKTDRFVEFSVKDNGIGIDPQHHHLIFGVFQRLKEVEVEGTGIGLAVVKKIVDLAGGKIWFESKKGEGATFFFQLPIIAVPDPE
jgi:signal transduction histidine kinase